MTGEKFEGEEEFEGWSEGAFSKQFNKDFHMVVKKKKYCEDNLAEIWGVPYTVLTNLEPGEWVHDFQNSEFFPLDEVDEDGYHVRAIKVKNGRLEHP